MYHLSDDKVITHGHIAYGAPNRWHNKKHRGRKRCGMLFAMPSMRRALGLKTRPAYDVDTRAGRLAVGDAYLHKVLYGNIDTMPARGSPPMPAPRQTGNWFSRLVGSNNKPNPAGAKKKLVSAPKTAAKSAISASIPKNIPELKNRGYGIKGTISKKNTAMKIAGKKWNSAETYYVIKGKVVPGNQVDATKLGLGVSIWMKR